jgi:tight adherence protein B
MTFWLLFLAAFWLLLMLLLWPARNPMDFVKDRLAELQAGPVLSTLALPESPAEVAAALERPRASLKHRLRAAFVAMVEKVAVRKRSEERLARRLLHAGLRWRPGEFLALQVALAVVGAFLLAFVLPSGLGVVVGGLVGWALPAFWLGRRTAQRQKAFGHQLADAIGMLANALRSGYSFLQAMDVIGRDMPDPIASEFAQVLRESRLNIPLETALQGLSRRVPSEDLELLVTAVLIQRQVGGNLSEILDRIQDTIRERIRILGQVRTLTAQGRMSGWIVSLLPVGLLGILSVLNPTYVKPLFTHPIGWGILGIATVMQSIGIVVIRRMVNVEV